MFKPSHIFAFSLGAGLTLILMLFIGYQLDGDMGLCKLEAAGNPAETPVTCAREWIGALSGWIAASGALIVGLPTLKLLQQQIKIPVIEKQIQDNYEVADWISRCISDIRSYIESAPTETRSAKGWDTFIKDRMVLQYSGFPSSLAIEALNEVAIRKYYYDGNYLIKKDKKEKSINIQSMSVEDAKEGIDFTLGNLQEFSRNLFSENEKFYKWRRKHMPK
nr:hypothetical protein [uncultured Cohaesibacter sp.]